MTNEIQEETKLMLHEREQLLLAELKTTRRDLFEALNKIELLEKVIYKSNLWDLINELEAKR